ncbi:Z-ring formation inhibitor MciZ [Falsibacillus albus]|uniref:Z-ring formation inhibitor MciZ n=1 Tax=Falsibacillus albus TaxID=2478915 RepID=A0A3L7JQ18_9BACI|nr:Z-ring formation inhibitor MciZ [Falsibacillus albus]RLQ90642.1 Z-ring formation inhibitor MciZ [Falsibacillus albus]
MKVYVTDKGFVVQGKAWEVKQYLKMQQRRYPRVADWLKDVSRGM